MAGRSTRQAARADGTARAVVPSPTPPTNPAPFVLMDLELIEQTIADNNIQSKLEAESLIAEIDELKRQFDSKVSTSDSESLTARFELAQRCRTAKASLLVQVTEFNERNRARVEPSSLLKLPALEVGKFDGTVTKWASFKANFSAVINDVRIKQNEEAKRQFLFRALEPGARELVENLQEATFDECWKILVDTFDDPLRRAKAHFDALSRLKEEKHPLRKRLIEFRQHSAGLQSAYAERGLDPFEQIVISWFCQNVPKYTCVDWEKKCADSGKSSLSDFFKFIDQTCLHQERHTPTTGSTSMTRPSQATLVGRKLMPRRGHSLMAAKQGKCCCCKKEVHYINACGAFLKMTPDDRRKFIAEQKLCQVCFSAACKGRKQCPKSFLYCRACRKPHHSLLHVEKGKGKCNNTNSICGSNINKTTNTAEALMEPAPMDVGASSHRFQCNGISKVVACYMSYHELEECLLTTVIVRVRIENSDQFVEARAILDGGSQYDFVTDAFANKIQASRSRADCSVVSLSQSITPIKSSALVHLQSKNQKFKSDRCCLIVQSIVDCPIPSEKFDISDWKIPPHASLADPHFNLPSDVDMLLGLQLFWSILGQRKVNIGAGLPMLWQSKLGWLITGTSRVPVKCATGRVLFSKQDMSSLMKMIERFWETETIDISTSTLTLEEQECEELFTSTTTRRDDGRFVVKLPLKYEPSVLGESRTQAERRFKYLENRFEKNPSLREGYVAYMNEFITLGHMDKVCEETELPTITFYIPHHAVLKDTSSTTKVRVVVDASARSSSGLSLNDICNKGPVVQPKLFSTLLRFRVHRYAFVADVTKMYRMVKVTKSDSYLQLVLWRDSTEKPIETYRLNTLTFGTKPAPYLATRCLQELSFQCRNEYQLAAPVLHDDFYVDDVLTGASSVEAADQTKRELRAVLESAGFELNKWASNELALLADIPKENLESQFALSLDEKHTIKTLGMLWLPEKDVFKIFINKNHISDAKTKRQVLSIIMSIFDPLGFVGPVTAKAKCFMQQLWSVVESESKENRKLSWDEKIPPEFLSQWNEFIGQLHMLHLVEIPRHVGTDLNTVYVELHGFSDASKRSYGAVFYLRVLQNFQTVQVFLLCSKSRVAPLKELTIPRLELQAAVLLSELAHEVYACLSMRQRVDKVRLWSDAQVALTWLSSPASQWNIYVANRVKKIQSLTSDWIWDYVDTKENPADVLSRGCNPQELLNHPLWYTGPGWLSSSTEPWPDTKTFVPNKIEKLERKSVGVSLATVKGVRSEMFDLVGEGYTGKYSVENWSKFGLTKFLRLVAWLLRFSHNCRFLASRRQGGLKSSELRTALTTVVKLAQEERFHEEIKCVQGSRPVSEKSQLKYLNLMLDDQRVLRVGGRLDHASLSFEQRHRIVLPHKHPLAYMIVLHTHVTNFHAGPQLLKSSLRRSYWIVRQANEVSDCLRRCLTCTKLKAQTFSAAMANLPKSRVTLIKPFHETGVDYAGPFGIIGKGGRHRIMTKAYISIFVCFSTKAIHLEAVSDLTSETFIAALERFVGRRGLPSVIHSDNGTNFVGASKTLMRAFLKASEESIESFATNKGFKWSFIPPHSPHFGGLWEAGVKSVKSRLQHILSGKALTFEEFATFLVQVEACLNSRPLTPESNDPNELNALTPAHFLIGGPTTAIPCDSLIDIPENRVKAWQRVKRMSQLFWKRYNAEYLNTLQQRGKWRCGGRGMRVNDLVVIKDDGLPPTSWRLGRIEALHPGADGISRVATVRTAFGPFKRPFTKLVPLPTN